MQNLYKIVLFLYCLSTVEFFNPLGLIPLQTSKLFSYIFMGGLFVIPIHEYIRKNGEISIQLFKKTMRNLLIIFCISIFMPLISGYEQTVSQGFISTMPFWGYALYFSLHRSSIGVDFLNKMIFIIAIMGMIVYVINLISFPNIIFGTIRSFHEESSRAGMVRVSNPSIIYIIYTFFFSIEKWKSIGERKWFVYIVLSYMAVFFTFTRQYIILCTVLGFFQFLKNMLLYRRILYSFFISLLVLFVVPEIPVVNSIMSYTIKQYEKSQIKEGDIRVQDAKYFGYEDYDNFAQRLIGHGNPSYHSAWGQQQKEYYDRTGRYKVDAGIFGFLWTFGIIAGFLYVKILIMAIRQKWLVGRFFFLFLLGASVASGPMLMANKIILWIMALYIIDKKQDEVRGDNNIEL